MGDINRFRYADAKATYKAAPASATVVEIGDLLVYNSGNPQPIDQVSWNTDLTTTRQDAADDFAGIAMTASADGETDPVTIATQGVYEFPLGSAGTAEVFDYFTAVDSGSNSLVKDEVATTSTLAEAFGYVWRRYGSNTSYVLVRPKVLQARESIFA